MLKARMGDAASQVSTAMLPDWIVRLAALVSPRAAQIAPDLGKVRTSTSEKAKRLLGWEPRSAEDALVATAESLLQLGLLHHSKTA